MRDHVKKKDLFHPNNAPELRTNGNMPDEMIYSLLQRTSYTDKEIAEKIYPRYDTQIETQGFLRFVDKIANIRKSM